MITYFVNNNNNNICYLFIFYFFILAAVAAAAGSVVSIAPVVNSLKTVLDNIQTNRRIAVAVSNETKHPWEAISVYFSSGTSDAILPLDVPPGTN